MPVPQSLQTIAEISIAFAGFSGLIVAFRRNQGPLTEIEKFRLQVLLGLAFGAMFLSMLPEWFQDLKIEDSRVWVFSSAVLCLYSVLFLSFWIVRSRPIRRNRVFPPGLLTTRTSFAPSGIFFRLVMLARTFDSRNGVAIRFPFLSAR